MDCFSAASTSNAYDPDKPIMTALGFLGKLPGGKFPLPPFYVVKDPRERERESITVTANRNSATRPTTQIKLGKGTRWITDLWFNLTSLNLGLT